MLIVVIGGIQGGVLNTSNPNGGGGGFSTVVGETKTYTTSKAVSTVATSTVIDATTTWTKEYPTFVQTVTVVVTSGLLATTSPVGVGIVATSSAGSGQGGSPTQAVPAPTNGANSLAGGGKERIWWFVVTIVAGFGALRIL